MRVLMLGGTGFIGVTASRALAAAGHDAVTASRSPSADVLLDVSDQRSLDDLVSDSQYDVIVNLLGAGLSSGTADAAAMQHVNAELPVALLTTLLRLPRPPLLVHAASSTERLPGQAIDESQYSRTKHDGSTALRSLARATGAAVTVMTIHNTYGSGQPGSRFVAAMAARLRSGEPVSLNFPHRVRDFVFVDDVAACIRSAVEAGADGLEATEAGTGTGLTLRETALKIASALDRPSDLVRVSEHRPVDPNPVTVCPVPAGTYGLCTTDFDAGIRRTLGDN